MNGWMDGTDGNLIIRVFSAEATIGQTDSRSTKWIIIGKLIQHPPTDYEHYLWYYWERKKAWAQLAPLSMHDTWHGGRQIEYLLSIPGQLEIFDSTSN